jgi:hypothetical protein
MKVIAFGAILSVERVCRNLVLATRMKMQHA